MQNELAELHERLKQLVSENSLLNAALENMTQGLSMFDRHQRLIFANNQYTSMYGMQDVRIAPGTTLAEIVQMRINNGIYAGDSPEGYITEREQWAREPTRSQDIHQLSDGRTIAVSRQFLPDGSWLGTHTDITDLLALQNELLDSRETHKNLLETLNVIPWEFDWNTQKFIYVGPQASQFGYSDDDWYSEDFWTRIIHPDDREQAMAFCKTATEKGEDYDFEYRVVKADGSHCWVRDMVNVVADSSGSTILRGVFIDISERKKAEALTLRLDRIVEDSINEVFVFDAETLKFLQVNASACKNLGYTLEELVKLTPIDLKPEFTLEKFEDAIAPLRNGEKDHIRFQTIHRRKDGSHYDTDIILQQIQSEHRPVFAAIIEDITERKNAERELIEHRDHLQILVDNATQELKANAEELKETLGKERELNELQRQFVSMASHEFRTPLAIIDATAQRMKSRAGKNKLTPEDTARRVEKIRDAVSRMTRLMESTLSAARMEEGKIQVEIESCDIRQVVKSVCTSQQEIAKNHIISCEFTDLPKTIQADTGCLEQAITNLLSNAVKYAPKAPEIRVVAFAKGDQAVISVRDHGIGIDEDDLSRIGERFFRAKTSSGTAGTGIGLNLVRSLIEMHGGTLNVESKKGEGSTFTICLPIGGPDQSNRTTAMVA